MSTEGNKAVIRRTIDEIWNKGNLSIIPEQIAPDYVAHNADGQEYRGQEGFRLMVTSLRSAIPDLHYEVHELIAEGDKVVCHSTITGTFRGDTGGGAASGKKFSIRQMYISTVKDGRSVETWSLADALTMNEQLGVTPAVFKQNEERNKEVIRRTMEDVWTQGNLSLITELVDPDYVGHREGMPDVRGLDGFRSMVDEARAAFPDLRCIVEQLTAEGDHIACMYTLTGTHKGNLGGIAPTKKRIKVKAMFLTVMKNGKSLETWTFSDTILPYQQLGIALPVAMTEK